MDEIIWHSESLQLIASVLGEASNEMEAEIALLRHCRSETPLALKDHDGTLLDNILEQMGHTIQKLTNASGRALELARAVQFTDALFEDTERNVQQLFENISLSAQVDETISSGRWDVPAHVAIARGLAERTLTVPEWLSSAAEQFFQSTGS